MTEPLGEGELSEPIQRRPGLTPIEGQPFPQQEATPEGATKEFAPLMEGGPSAAEKGTPSPMDLAGQQQGMGGEMTAQQLEHNIARLQNKIDDLKTEMTPARWDELSEGQRQLLHRKLTQFNSSLENLSGLAQMKFEKPNGQEAVGKSIGQYLDWLTKGQSQIATAWENLKPDASGKISVAQMFRVQAIIAGAERSINFASAITGKATEFIKTIMQTQL